MNERERIGALLAQKRNEAGLSVRALAEIAGVSYQNVTKIENGKYNVNSRCGICYYPSYKFFVV